MICLTSETLVASAKFVITSTFYAIREIPFSDTKCPKYSISLLKNSHSHIFDLNPSSQNLIVYVSSVLLPFDCISTSFLSKIPKCHLNTKRIV